jgi:hypothetical protein
LGIGVHSLLLQLLFRSYFDFRCNSTILDQAGNIQSRQREDGMSDRTVRITYWIATGFVALVYLGGAIFYVTANDMVTGMYDVRERAWLPDLPDLATCRCEDRGRDRDTLASLGFSD